MGPHKNIFRETGRFLLRGEMEFLWEWGFRGGSSPATNFPSKSPANLSEDTRDPETKVSPENWVVKSFPFGMAYFQGIMLALGRLYPKEILRISNWTLQTCQQWIEIRFWGIWCTTKYYSSTILYYKVSLMTHDGSLSHMNRYLHCAEQQKSSSNVTKYCACHEKLLSWLILLRYETSFTMCGATGLIRQPRQILRLPRKITLMIDPAHIWNVIYNAQSKNCACLEKWHSWLLLLTYETLFTMRGATRVTLQLHQILPCHAK